MHEVATLLFGLALGLVSSAPYWPRMTAAGHAETILSGAKHAMKHDADANFVTASGIGVNVKSEFGAKGDNSTDDTAAFQAAIVALAASGGGELHVPPGHYCIKTGPIDIASDGITISGVNQRAVLLDACGADVKIITSTGFGTVIRDVRIAWLNTQNSFDRYRITGQLLENARQSYDLAQARYKEGISSIVEFNQAELNLVSAEISYADTRYEYLVQQSALSFQTGTLH